MSSVDARQMARCHFKLLQVVGIEVLLLCQLACIAVQYSSPKRAQDADAAKRTLEVTVLQASFASSRGFYARSFADLEAHFSRSSGSRAELDGYQYEMNITPSGYDLKSWPIDRNSGYRSFFADETGVVRFAMFPKMAGPSDQPLQ